MNTRAIASFALTTALLLSGCSGSAASHRQNSVSDVQSVLDSAIAANEELTPDDATISDGATPTKNADDNSGAESVGSAAEGIDVDLTRLNSTMIFSEVNRMVCEPEEFIGKTVRVAGQFALVFGYDENGEVNPEQAYFACIVPDATACCSSGIEFERGGDYRYPEDYPEEGDDITVTGVFEIYEEYGAEYFHLVNAMMEA